MLADHARSGQLGRCGSARVVGRTGCSSMTCGVCGRWWESIVGRARSGVLCSQLPQLCLLCTPRPLVAPAPAPPPPSRRLPAPPATHRRHGDACRWQASARRGGARSSPSHAAAAVATTATAPDSGARDRSRQHETRFCLRGCVPRTSGERVRPDCLPVVFTALPLPVPRAVARSGPAGFRPLAPAGSSPPGGLAATRRRASRRIVRASAEAVAPAPQSPFRRPVLFITRLAAVIAPAPERQPPARTRPHS